MKLLKRIAKLIGLLIIIGGLSIGVILVKKYYTSYMAFESLNNTILDIKITSDDLQAAQKLKTGKIQSKRLINLSEIPPLWKKLSKNNSLKNEYKYLKDVNFFVITYKSDSLLVNGIVAEPKRDGKFPVIIFNRGGNKEIGKVAKAKTLYSLIFATSKLANEGYVVIASCYRENDEFGGEDIQDVLNLTETVKDIGKANPNRIGMLGWSRGGMMTYLALKKTDVITTAVIGNGPTDLSQLVTDRPEMETEVCAKLIPSYHRNKAEELKKRSVIYWADELSKKSSLLILCGTKDKRVNPNQADKIAEKLVEMNYDFELRKFETNHSFSNKKNELNKLLIKWFKEKL
ncbi:peptidase [Ancylomarina salipaludis]|uniref:Peptidase n=1 Tax=Ancylomarina salipaludis TaxID=2501299 RepID=A0A4V1N080_9BACT|nr:prolyl oligopeptidase family serine peptidase [Ancylomarina salipaludis]RXQ95632.1 peptidase [Ancylomarina salipaludis]